MVKEKEYCCCAIPMLNVGIYTTLTEQLVLAVLAGTLTIATPRLVGASVPSFAPFIFTGVCYALAGVQLFGFFGVWKEKTSLFRTYTWIHLILTIAAFSVAGSFIGYSASQHDAAARQCERDFFSPLPNSTNGPVSTGGDTEEGEVICEIFTWVGVGLMGGLWLVLAIAQTYFYFVVAAYGTGQRADHKQYYSLGADNNPNDILLAERIEPLAPPPPHSRQDSFHDAPDSAWNPRENSFDSVERPGMGTYGKAGNYEYRHAQGPSAGVGGSEKYGDYYPPAGAADSYYNQDAKDPYNGPGSSSQSTTYPPPPRRQGSSATATSLPRYASEAAYPPYEQDPYPAPPGPPQGYNSYGGGGGQGIYNPPFRP